MRRSIKFGIIGCGLMGREFASAVSRWCHLNLDIATPEIIGVCDANPESLSWFEKNLPGLSYKVTDYRQLLDTEDIDAIYCAVPHHLHELIYTDIIRSGKHLLGEKPFGIDRAANSHILEELSRHPGLIVRCASEFPFYPACQRVIEWIDEKRFGRIIEVKAGLKHSSDMDLTKPVNWKRQVRYNGEYGCMGDLGIHTQHIPFHAGWIPQNVYAMLSNIVTKRPDNKGNMVECNTFDNATMVCEAQDKDGTLFPLYLETKRMDPGSTNNWYIRVSGLEASAYFTTEDPNAFYYLNSLGREQAWSRLVIGCKTLFPTITGSIFEFGFSDAILQMWVAFILELEGKPLKFGCFTPEETRLSHALQTAALASHKNKTIEKIMY